MYMLNIARAMKSMSLNEIRDFIFESYFIVANKLIEKNTWSLQY